MSRALDSRDAVGLLFQSWRLRVAMDQRLSPDIKGSSMGPLKESIGRKDESDLNCTTDSIEPDRDELASLDGD